MPIDQAIDFLVNFSDPFKVARGNLANYGLTGVEHEAAMAAGALIENYPYGTQDIDLVKLEADSPYHSLLKAIWDQPPGLRLQWWEHNNSNYSEAFQQSVMAAYLSFRNSLGLHPWKLPWK